MKHRYHLGRKLAALTLVLLVFASSAQALELRVSSLDGLALSAEVFSENEAFEGVYVASVPSQLDAEVSLGARTLRAGDVLDRSMLSQLLVLPAENRDASCELVYCPIEGGEVQPSRALELSILTGKNEAPVCRDVKFETYKNIANTGVLPPATRRATRSPISLSKSRSAARLTSRRTAASPTRPRRTRSARMFLPTPQPTPPGMFRT